RASPCAARDASEVSSPRKRATIIAPTIAPPRAAAEAPASPASTVPNHCHASARWPRLSQNQVSAAASRSPASEAVVGGWWLVIGTDRATAAFNSDSVGLSTNHPPASPRGPAPPLRVS